MTCEEATALAGSYLDSEDEIGTPIANHVASCPQCARLITQRRNWRRVVRLAPRFEPGDPAGLANRVRAAVASAAVMNAAAAAGTSTAEASAARQSSEQSDRAPAPLPFARPDAADPAGPAMMRRSTAIAGWVMAVAALLLCGSLSLWIWSLTRSTGVAEGDLVAHEVVASHIRSLMAQRLVAAPEFAAFAKWPSPERLYVNVATIDRQDRKSVV